MTWKDMAKKIVWLGHDCFRVDAEKVVYFDPYQISGGPKADLILVSHDHFDHCSPEDVAKIQGKDTTIVTIAAAASQLTGNIQIVKPGDELTVQGVKIQAVPAYNVNKFRSPGQPFHPKSMQGNGYVIKLGGETLYHAGDTDFIPEMAQLDVTVALLPAGSVGERRRLLALEGRAHPRLRTGLEVDPGGPVGGDPHAVERQGLGQGPVPLGRAELPAGSPGDRRCPARPDG